jgi:hypothetical protein
LKSLYIKPSFLGVKPLISAVTPILIFHIVLIKRITSADAPIQVQVMDAGIMSIG